MSDAFTLQHTCCHPLGRPRRVGGHLVSDTWDTLAILCLNPWGPSTTHPLPASSGRTCPQSRVWVPWSDEVALVAVTILGCDVQPGVVERHSRAGGTRGIAPRWVALCWGSPHCSLTPFTFPGVRSGPPCPRGEQSVQQIYSFPATASTLFLSFLLHYLSYANSCMGIGVFLWAPTLCSLLATSPLGNATVPEEPSLPWSAASAPVSVRISTSGLGLLTHGDTFPVFTVCWPVSGPAECWSEPGTPQHYAGGWRAQPAWRVN